ncbi:MAG: hypothetical protein KBT03_09495 [Bacteroidales bacterium]|nr:hypothetical protein [Candidatus Scybalousia scybalohippi]
MSSPNTNKSLYEVLRAWFANFSQTLNCVKIGEIVSYNKQEQTATIKILHKNKDPFVISKEALVDYPILEKVPVVVFGGSQTYIAHSINTGDQCLLLFSDYMIDRWWATGATQPSDFPRKHDISDAIAIVGMHALPKAIQNIKDGIDLHYSDNSSIVIGETIEVKNQQIKLDGSVTATGALTAPTLNATTAASGSFVTVDNKTVTVVNGIITSIA